MSELAEKVLAVEKEALETPWGLADGRYIGIARVSAADLARQVLDHEATIAERDATIARLTEAIEHVIQPAGIHRVDDKYEDPNDWVVMSSGMFAHLRQAVLGRAALDGEA